jgi:crossover junction endodeoxyribonuclease RuvC
VRILGVDPGSRATGWALVTFGTSVRLEDAGVLRPPAALPFERRLLWLRDALADVVRRMRPDAAAVERVFAGVNAQSLILLGEARGVLLLTLAETKIAAAEITPAEVKRAVTGTGAAEKEQVRRMVASLLGRRLPLDAADAAAAALAHGFVAAPRAARVAPAPPAVPGRAGWKRRPGG